MASKQNTQEFLTRRALHTAVMNPVGSKTFLKKIVPMAISYILHQRVEFDESDFNTRSFGGIEYKVFKPKMRNRMLRDVSSWTTGALDALDRNYLREIYLILESNEDEGKIHESYKFQFKYMGDDVIPLVEQMATKRDLEESTDCLLTAIESLNAHSAFKEEDVKLKMALTYYEDVTPANYQPPFFEIEKENVRSVLQSLAKQPRDYLHLGHLKTGYHIVKCRAKGEVFSLNASMSSANIANDGNIDTIEDPPINTVEQKEDAVEKSVVLDNPPITIDEVTEPPSQEESSRKNISTLSEDCVTVSNEDFHCSCNISIILKRIDSVLCSQCLTFQHCACLGYLEGTDVPDTYVCPECEDSAANLTPALKDRRSKISMFRLVVAVAYFTKEVPEDVLKLFPKETADWIFKILTQQHIILEKAGKYKVNMKLITRKYLNAIFTVNERKRKMIADSMNLEDDDMSQANSMVLGGETCGKKRKRT